MRHFSFVFFPFLFNFILCYYSTHNCSSFASNSTSNDRTFCDFCSIFLCLFMLLNAIHTH